MGLGSLEVWRGGDDLGQFVHASEWISKVQVWKRYGWLWALGSADVWGGGGMSAGKYYYTLGSMRGATDWVWVCKEAS